MGVLQMPMKDIFHYLNFMLVIFISLVMTFIMLVGFNAYG